MAERFYPRLSSIVKIEDLPEALSFINSGLSAVFDKLYFRDLQVVKSEAGDSAFYSLSLLTPNALEFEIPGMGVSLALNRAVGASGFMEIPVTVSYEWKILKIIRSFKLESFSNQADQFFEIISKALLGMTSSDLLKLLFASFFEDLTPTAALGQFVTSVNAHYGVTATASSNPTFELALAETIGSVVIATGKDPFTIVYEVFIEDPFGDDLLSKENLNKLFESIFGLPPVEYIKDLLIPKIGASLTLRAELVFERNILTPLDPSGNPLGAGFKSAIEFAEGQFNFSSVTGIGYEVDTAASLNYPSAIGNTGLTISFTEAKLDLSRKRNIPEATADGRPDDFMGVFIKNLEIGLPPFIKNDPANPNPPSVKIVGRDLLIGTGGISGTIGLEGSNLCKKFGDKLQACFNSFDMTFKQNAIVSSNIRGELIIPGFKDTLGNDAKIEIIVSFDSDGNFTVTAKEENGIDVIKIPQVLSIELNSVSVGRKNDRWFIAVSGALDFETFPAPIGQFIPDKLEITKLVIWDDGQIELEGGKITLPKAISLKIGPVELSITALGLGSHEQEWSNGSITVVRPYKYFVFDGGIDTGPGGVDVSGSGIAFYWTTDDNSGYPRHYFVRIQSIAIDIIIPGNATPETASLLLKGFLSMKSPEGGGDGTEYAGGVEFTLPKLKMGGSASMRLNPKIPAFLVDVGLELSTPIVLGSTGLGIYGFRGLVGQRYVSTKAAAGLGDDAPWWQYYKAKVADTYREGIVTDKFEQTDGFSLGAGVSVATVPDGGRTFSSKLFFLLSLPEVFLLQGQGQILKERIGLDTTTDPPFFALLAISSTSIEAAFGVNYKVPDDGANPGAIATVNALIEMGFFWGNSSAWYVNLGKDQPDDRRIQVRLLSLFNAYFYMMLSSSGIRAGAGASYELKKKFGPLKAELYAYLDTTGKISFKPKQIGGSIAIGGGVKLSIFGFGFSLSAAAGLAAEAPKPFIVSGYVKACVRVFRKDRCAKFNFTWTFENSLDLQEINLVNLELDKAAKAINIQTKESFDLYAGTSAPTPAQLTNHYVPADSFIDIEFLKGVLPSAAVRAKYGGNTQGSFNIDYVAPQRGKSDRVRHEYELESVAIKYHDGSTWRTYDVYEASTPLDLAPFVTTDLTTLPFGYWQYQTPNLHNKLRILGQSPIEYVSQGSGDLILEDSQITLESIFCDPEPLQKDCFNFTNFDPGLGEKGGQPLLPENQLFFHGNALMQITNGDGVVATRPYSGFQQAICFEGESSLWLNFVEPVTCVDLLLCTVDTTATVFFQERKTLSGTGSSGQPLFTYVTVQSAFLGTNVHDTISYDDVDRPIERVEIRSGRCESKPTNYYYPTETSGNGVKTGSETITNPNLIQKDLTDPNFKPLDTEEKLVFRSANAAPNISEPAIPYYNEPTGQGKKDCEVNDLGQQLVNFLNTVFYRYDHNVPTFNIWPQDLNAYNGVFYNSVLYGAPPLQGSINANNSIVNGTFIMNLFDSKKWSCTVELSASDGSYISPGTWKGLTRVENPQCVPSKDGSGYEMIVDGIFQGGGGIAKIAPQQDFTLPLRIKSCWEVCTCEDTCGVFLYQVCTATYEVSAYNQTLPGFPAVQNETQTMINAFEGSIRPIWRFDTPFYIEVKTKDSLYRESGQDLLTGPYNNTFYFGFRTAGPPGHFHRYINPGGGNPLTRPDYSALKAEDKEDQFKLAKLLHYIDFSKSYPNADGQLINAKPLFYKAPKLLMFWTQPYVYSFFQDWDDHNGTQTALNSQLEVLVKDPAPDPAVSPPSPVAASWVVNSLPIISQDVQILNNMIINAGSSPCTPSATISPLAVNSDFTLPDLEPLKLYTAIFNGQYKRVTAGSFTTREVHRYGFQTSRYGDFTEQVQSWQLADPDDPSVTLDSIFVVEEAFDNVTQIQVAMDIIDPADPMPKTDPLRQTYGHPFNRLLEGALQLESIHPPVGTEFNLIKNSITGNIIGILVKNPEPFNDPKIPLSDIKNTVRLSINSGPTTDYTALFSKDYSQVFLSNSNLTMNIPAGASAQFRFEYKQFNGGAYVVLATETVNITLL